MNYFVEGLQGSGKSTLVRRLAAKHPDHQVIFEGDYSPIELSWCAYTTEAQYDRILSRYPALRPQIEEKTFTEADRRIICYTKIITDTPGFHKDLEQYEIYNDRVSWEEFRCIVLGRFRQWHGDRTIFECSLFQNIVEDMILFRNAPDEEIFRFYEDAAQALEGKDFHILYLRADDIAANLSVIRKERSDKDGKELWFPLMLGFFNESPFARAHGCSGEEDLLRHFQHRQDLELAILRDIFPGRYTVLQSKHYEDSEF